VVKIWKEFFISVKLDQEAVGDKMGQLAVLRYLAEAIKENAPAGYREDQKYQQLEQALF